MQIELWEAVFRIIIGYIVIGHILAPLAFKPLQKKILIKNKWKRIMLCEIMALMWAPIMIIMAIIVIIFIGLYILGILLACIFEPPKDAYCKYVLNDQA